MSRWWLEILTFVLIIAILLIGGYTTGGRGQELHVDTAIVFVSDVSGSMDMEERRVVRESHAAALLSEEVVSLYEHHVFAFAYVEFSSGARRVVDWTLVSSEADAQNFATTMLAATQGPYNTTTHTSIAAGLAEANQLFNELPYTAGRLVVDVICDGINNKGDVSIPHAALIGRGVVINAVPLLMHQPMRNLIEYLQKNVIGGLGAFIIALRPEEQEVGLTGMADMQRYPGLPSVLRQKMLQELL